MPARAPSPHCPQAVARQPTVVYMYVPPSFTMYSGGVYSCTAYSSSYGWHAVLVVVGAPARLLRISCLALLLDNWMPVLDMSHGPAPASCLNPAPELTLCAPTHACVPAPAPRAT